MIHNDREIRIEERWVTVREGENEVRDKVGRVVSLTGVNIKMNSINSDQLFLWFRAGRIMIGIINFIIWRGRMVLLREILLFESEL